MSSTERPIMSRIPAPNAAAVPATASRDRSVRTAVHVCEILDCFADGSQARKLTEIAKEVGLRNSSVYRLVQTLANTGYLLVDPKTRTYRLGGRLARLVSAYEARVTLITVCTPTLERLRSATHETTAVQIREGNQRYNVVELPSAELIRMEIGQNVAYPITKGASADVLRAFSSEWSRQADRKKMLSVRRAGYSVSLGALVKGGVATYVPLFNAAKTLIGSIGVYGPAFRIDARAIPKIAALLKDAAAELSSRIEPGLPIQ
jgi:IclR family transcriptional regulator, acetate operon repressor